METPTRNSESNAASPDVDIVPTDPIAVRELVRKQVEYYFSKENLTHDAYLTSQMDANMSVSISVIMKFGKIKNLTQDEELLKEALSSSTAVTIIDNRIKSNMKGPGRSTIILRDIPSSTPEEEVRAIFAYDGCKPISSIRKDIENTWFVIMDSEEDAKDTILDLKIKKRTFRGESVKCRLKTEAVVKSYYPVSAPGVVNVQPFGAAVPPYNMMGGYQQMGGYAYGGWQQNAPPSQSEYSNAEQALQSGSGSGSPTARINNTSSPKDGRNLADGVPTKEGRGAGRDNQQNNKGSKDGQMSRDGARDKKQQTGNNSNQKNNNAGKDGGNGSRDNNKDRNQGGRNNKNGNQPSNAGGKTGWGDSNNKRPIATSFDLSGMNFPPLAAPENISAIPQAGYGGIPFVKYTHDEIINIVKNISDVVLPETIMPEHHSCAMTSAPNMDLLLRQRTFSIDETREQLRQGRPVQREAIVTGAVDLESMCYGDTPAAPITETVQAVPVVAVQPSSKPAAAGSWAGILKKSGAPTETVSQQLSPPKKPAPTETKPQPSSVTGETIVVVATGDDKKGSDQGSKGDKKKDRKKENKRDGKREGSDATAPAVSSTETQSSWGGKPSFATILKQQAEHDSIMNGKAAPATFTTATSQVVDSSSPESNPSTPSRKPRAGGEQAATSAQSPGWNNRNNKAAGEKPSADSKRPSDGAWTRKAAPVSDRT